MSLSDDIASAEIVAEQNSRHAATLGMISSLTESVADFMLAFTMNVVGDRDETKRHLTDAAGGLRRLNAKIAEQIKAHNLASEQFSEKIKALRERINRGES